MLSGIGKVIHCKQQHFNGHPATSKALQPPSVKPTQGWSDPLVLSLVLKTCDIMERYWKWKLMFFLISPRSEMCDVDHDGCSGGAVWQRKAACIQIDGCSSVHQSSQNPP